MAIEVENYKSMYIILSEAGEIKCILFNQKVAYNEYFRYTEKVYGRRPQA